jgi:hypothetical protein
MADGRRQEAGAGGRKKHLKAAGSLIPPATFSFLCFLPLPTAYSSYLLPLPPAPASSRIHLASGRRLGIISLRSLSRTSATTE